MAHVNIAHKRIEKKGLWLFWMIIATTMPALTGVAIGVAIYIDYLYRLEEYPELLALYQAGNYYPKPTEPSFPTWQMSLAIGLGIFVAIVSFLIMLANRQRVLYGDKDVIIYNEGRRLFSVATKEGRVTAFLSDIYNIEVIDAVTPVAKKEGQDVEPTYGKIKFYMRGRKGPFEIISVKISGVNYVMEQIDKIRFPKKYPQSELKKPEPTTEIPKA